MRRSRLLLSVLVFLAGSTPGYAQQNVLDLRVIEIDSHGDVRYQNFIYGRTSADGRFLFEGLYLHVPPDDYHEVSIGGGYRLLRAGDLQAYGLVHVADATDGGYLQPALLVLDTAGRATGSLFVQHYAPLSDRGVHQWLIDSAEAQYAIRGPFALGVSAYLFKPAGGDWLTKIGPKFAIADRHGATELRIARINQGGYAFQLRRLFAF
jgi:hypothetical protein